MKTTHDLSELEWTVAGYTPYLWLFEREFGAPSAPTGMDVPPVPARVPGSVQAALRRAGILPDYDIGLQARHAEWVEHRHWIFRTCLPHTWRRPGASYRLECQGLDYAGWIWLNGHEVGAFKGTHEPHVFDLTPHLGEADNTLEIVFDLPPRWLGQFGYTSRMTEWKTRFNYTWDWVPRLVQVGIWDPIALVEVAGSELGPVRCTTDADPEQRAGILELAGPVRAGRGARVRVELERDGRTVRAAEYPPPAFERGIRWEGLPVELWWPNLEGDQPLYSVVCRLVDEGGVEQDRWTGRVGFRQVRWQACDGAPAAADPWVCVVNGLPVFLQGVNFPPIHGLFADLTRDDYERRLRLYRQLGANLLRINACQFLERTWFYDLCDELGLMVWQDLPLTSSGIDNWPPEDDASIATMAAIARSFVERRRHHASLVLWSGGNELQGDLEGRKRGMGKPCGLEHPMLRRLQAVVQELDPGRRYIPTSPCGPRAGATPADFGKGLHWDVHGGAAMGTWEDAQAYWAADDALFRSEVYCSGASPVALIRRYAGDLPVFPATADSPYWSHPTIWWIDWHKLVGLHGREPADLDEYVAWSQEHQARMLAGEMKACKERFPACGGVLMWSGHDTSPMPINTSIIDFEGHLKPAAHAVAEVWRGPAGSRRGPGAPS